MIIHIVRQGESIKKIMDHYRIGSNELVSENKHITNWDNLIPGTKIKIPLLSEEVMEELEEMEPFIEDYYPDLENDATEIPVIIDESDSSENNSSNTYEDVKENDTSVKANDEEVKESPKISKPKEKKADIIQYLPHGYIRKI